MVQKFFTSVLATETNTFCPFPTAYEDFQAGRLGQIPHAGVGGFS